MEESSNVENVDNFREDVELENIKLVEDNSVIEVTPNTFDKIMTYVFFCIQGFGILLSWNSIINCPDYFLSIYDDWVIVLLSNSFMLFTSITLTFMTFFGELFNFYLRAITSYIICLLILIIIPILGYVLYWNIYIELIIITILVGILGFEVAILQSGIFGKASGFPKDMGGLISQSVMLGQGIVGLVMSILRVISKSTMSSYTASESALIYFVSGSIGILFCLLSFILIPISKYMQFHINKNTSSYTNPLKNSKELCAKGWKVIKLNMKNAGFVWFTLFLSMSVFPGISSVIPNRWGTWSKGLNDWNGIILNSLFTLFDMIGRFLPGIKVFEVKTKGWMWVVGIGRVIFPVLFVLYINPPWFLSDNLFPWITMILMALSNGYFSTLLMIDTAKSMDENPELKEISGTLMSLFIVYGVFSGTLFSYVLLQLGNSINF